MGCEDCHQTGYHGIEPIYEFLWLDKAQVVALSSENLDEFQRNTRQQLGNNSLLNNALQLWLKGAVSYNEVSSLVFLYEEGG